MAYWEKSAPKCWCCTVALLDDYKQLVCGRPICNVCQPAFRELSTALRPYGSNKHVFLGAFQLIQAMETSTDLDLISLIADGYSAAIIHAETEDKLWQTVQ